MVRILAFFSLKSSIINLNFRFAEFESTSPKESDELSCSSNLASLSTQLPAAPKPKKFFKSRNNAPPATPDPHRQPDALYHQQIVQHQAAQLQARIHQKAGGSPPYVAPPAGFYAQQSGSSKSPAAKEEVVKEKKKPGRKKKVKPVEVVAAAAPPPADSEELPVDPKVAAPPPIAEEAAAAPAAPTPPKKEKKEKKEKKQKKVKKEPEPTPELPKRNSTRTRNKVVNYNEDDDSFDSPIPFRNDTPPVGPSKLAAEPPAAVPEEPVAAPEPEPQQVVPEPQASPGKMKEPKTVVVPVPLSSPSVLEHPPIVLRISKVSRNERAWYLELTSVFGKRFLGT